MNVSKRAHNLFPIQTALEIGPIPEFLVHHVFELINISTISFCQSSEFNIRNGA
jgi:hypothetical protein